MALNTAKLNQALARIQTGAKDDGLAALLRIKKILRDEGLDLANVIEAGVSKLTRPVPSKAAFDQLFKGHFGQGRAVVEVSAEELPPGFFNATVRILDRQTIRFGEYILQLEVTHDATDAFRKYPNMTASGQVARRILDGIDEGDGQFSCAIRASRAGEAEKQPTIVELRS